MAYPELTALNLPGHSSDLSKQVVTIPEVLHNNRYHTYMTGKWHRNFIHVQI
jgi:arylsulfatase A-like enzyme